MGFYLNKVDQIVRQNSLKMKYLFVMMLVCAVFLLHAESFRFRKTVKGLFGGRRRKKSKAQPQPPPQEGAPAPEGGDQQMNPEEENNFDASIDQLLEDVLERSLTDDHDDQDDFFQE